MRPRWDQEDKQEGQARANQTDYFELPEIVHVISGNSNELSVNARANVASNRILEVVETSEHCKARCLDVPRGDLGEEDADGQDDQAHREDVANYVSENYDEAIGDSKD